ncbi:MAG: hypothetical protein ABIM49_05945 [candidate division WOR-3 bacterium]
MVKLLLLILSAFNNISLSSEITDNLRLLNRKDEGNVLNLKGYIQKDAFLNFENETNLYLINFDEYSLIFENLLYISKTFFFKNLGNRNKIFINLNIFYPPNYEIYKNTKFTFGNDLEVFFKNKYLLSINPEFLQKIYSNEIFERQNEIHIKSSLSIPMPFFFLILNFSPGIKSLKDENFYMYEINYNFDFPLTLDFSIFLLMGYKYSESQLLPFPDSLAEDPFFEEDIIKIEKYINLKLIKNFWDKGLEINLLSGFSERGFIPFSNFKRKDKKIENQIYISKFFKNQLILNFGFKNIMNFSNIEYFDYTKNAFEIRIGLIF